MCRNGLPPGKTPCSLHMRRGIGVCVCVCVCVFRLRDRAAVEGERLEDTNARVPEL